MVLLVILPVVKISFVIVRQNVTVVMSKDSVFEYHSTKIRYIDNMKKSFFVVITVIFLTGRLEAIRQCHNETGRCYWLGTGSKTWDAARTACQSEGGDLAVMETEELWNFASNLSTSRYFFSMLVPYLRRRQCL